MELDVDRAALFLTLPTRPLQRLHPSPTSTHDILPTF